LSNNKERNCGRFVGSCVCMIPESKCDGRHLCAPECGGSWRGKGIACKDDIILIGSKQPWKEHVELSDRMLNLSPEEAEVAWRLGWRP